jgi:hypothetical protein
VRYQGREAARNLKLTTSSREVQQKFEEILNWDSHSISLRAVNVLVDLWLWEKGLAYEDVLNRCRGFFRDTLRRTS